MHQIPMLQRVSKYIKNGLFAFSPFTGQILPSCADAATPSCKWPDLIILGNNIIDFLLTISVSLAAISFAYAGFLYMTAGGDTGTIQAHEILWKVVIGIVVSLGAWLIVHFIIVQLGVNTSGSNAETVVQ